MTQTLEAPPQAGNGNGGLARVRPSVMGSLAERYQMDAGRLLETLKATCIKGNATNEQVQAFCIVANRYGLDPFLKEIHAFAGQGGAIVPIVGIDGWSKIANSNPDFDGCDFTFDGEGESLSCTCTIYVKGRSHPVRVTEYLTECKRNTAPWTQFTRRMLRHKAFMQCVRLSFGLGGIYDEDEAKDIIQNAEPSGALPTVSRTAELAARFSPGTVAHPTDPSKTIDTRDAQTEPQGTAQAEQIIAQAAEQTRQQREQGGEGEPDVSGADAEPPAADLTNYLGFEKAMATLVPTGMKAEGFEAAMSVVRTDHGVGAPGKKGDAARKFVYEAASNGAFNWQTGKVVG